MSQTPIYPNDYQQSIEWLNDFLDHRFYDFGVYEDAIVDSEHFLNHSVLTPMLNVVLLTPLQIIDSVLEHAKQNDIPLNSLEGFIRQIIGWREFIRGIYVAKGTEERNRNFYDWVMVPNVYGMSQFADGGLMSTKPYISSSNYLRKMSNYKKAQWQEIWDALYWRFINKHRDVFNKNIRMKFMVSMYDKMLTEKKEKFIIIADNYFKSLDVEFN